MHNYLSAGEEGGVVLMACTAKQSCFDRNATNNGISEHQAVYCCYVLHIVAADFSAVQNAVLQLKIAVIKELSREDAITVLGFTGTPQAR